jgi:hypothetical protein
VAQVKWTMSGRASSFRYNGRTLTFRSPLAAKLITSPIYEYYSDYEGPSDYPTG